MEKFLNEEEFALLSTSAKINLIKKDRSYIMFLKKQDLKDENIKNAVSAIFKQEIKAHANNFYKMPKNIKNKLYGPVNTFVEQNPNNIVNLNKTQRALNNSKAVFSATKEDPTLLFDIPREEWRKSLIKHCLSLYGYLFKFLPEEDKEQTIYQYRAYKSIINSFMEENASLPNKHQALHTILLDVFGNYVLNKNDRKLVGERKRSYIEKNIEKRQKEIDDLNAQKEHFDEYINEKSDKQVSIFDLIDENNKK